MSRTKLPIKIAVATARFVVVALASSTRAAAQTETDVFNFDDAAGFGETPNAPLIFDAHGNLYGTTSSGGANSSQLGVAFELNPAVGGGWTETILHSFTGGVDGEFPLGGLVMDHAGNLYGTTQGSGGNNVSDGGTVFEVSPVEGGGWTETVLYSFNTNGTDAQFPRGSLIFDHAGNLYGTGAVGGAYNEGAIFELSPTAGGGWTEKVIYSFSNNGTDGQIPEGALVFDAAGNLYGATTRGGSDNDGIVFELTRRAGAWTEKILHTFDHNGQDGSAPSSNLIFDGAGNLYGATSLGGSHPCNCGTVFELTPKAGGFWSEKILHSFHNTDGWSPTGGVIFDAVGNLYGGTYQGGPNAYGYGTVFELSPTGTGVWTEKVLHAFGTGTDGQNPYGGLVFGSGGNLYGTTIYGGADYGGMVFELTP